MMQDHTSIKAAQYSYLTFFKAVKQAREWKYTVITMLISSKNIHYERNNTRLLQNRLSPQQQLLCKTSILTSITDKKVRSKTMSIPRTWEIPSVVIPRNILGVVKSS
jgi:hypothetical protein